MKNIQKSIFFLSLFILCLSANSQTSDVNAGCAPLSVTFAAPSSSSSYFWDFKDGATANIQAPTNTFTTPGQYIVEFKGSASGPVIGTITITVYEKPVPTIITSSALSGCIPLMVNLQMTATLPPGITITGYNWAMGNGTGFTTQNVNYTYAVPGVYDVTCQISTNYPSCNNNNTYASYISTSNPTASFVTNPNPAVACAPPFNVEFTNTSISTIPLTFDWVFGNGSTSTLSSPPTQLYTTNGQFTAQLTITDTNNCVKTSSRNIVIGNPTANFNIEDTVCINSPVTIQNTSSTGFYFWQFDAGTSSATSNQTNPTISFSTAGFHSIHLTNSSQSGLCSDDTTIVVFVEDPTTVITSTPTYSCSEPQTFQFNVSPVIAGATYSWTFDDDSTASGPNPLHIYDLEDTTYATRGEKILLTNLIVETQSGCTFTTSFVDTIHLVFARFMPDIARGCAPLIVTFSDSSTSNEDLTSWYYQYGDGTDATFSNNSPNSHTFTAPGTYNVVLRATNELGCYDISDTITIEVGTPIALDFSLDQTSICPGDSVTFTNLSSTTLIDSWHYSSDGEILSQCFQDDTPTIAFDDTVGFFNITLSGYYNGCFSSITKNNVLEVKGPIAKFNYLYNCDTPLDVQLINQSMGTTSISWDLGDSQSSTADLFTHSYASSGDYLVKLTASNASSGCPDSFDEFLIPIRQIQAIFLTDTNYCGSVPTNFDASQSTDVYANCNAGYTWAFSDPNQRPVTSQNPSSAIALNMSGPQSIYLIVTDINGCKDTATQPLNIYNLESIFNISDQSICLPDTILFTSASVSDTTITNWNWSFGDTQSSILENPTHTYVPSTATSFTVKLTISNALGCSDSLIKYISVYKPSSTITVTPSANICLGTPIQFSASDYTSQGSNLLFTWDFDDGTTGSSNSLNHTFLTSGTFQTTLHFEEQSSGCEDSIIRTINIQDYPQANLSTSVDLLPALCDPQLIEFSNNSVSSSPITSTQWSLSNGLTSVNPNPTFVFTKGQYTAQLIVSTSFGCRDTVTKAFTVYGPEGDFTYSTNSICLGEEIQFNLIDTADVVEYQWDYGDGLFDVNISPTNHAYYFIPPGGQTVVKLILYAENGYCPVTVEKTINIHEVRALFSRNDELDTNLCLGEILSLTNSSQNSDVYTWDFGDGTTGANGLGTFTHNYTAVDTMVIQLIVHNNQLGCSDTLSKSVIINPLPEVSALGDTVCYNSLAQLLVSNFNPAFNYSWTPGGNLSDPTIYNPTLTGIQSESFTVTATNPLTNCFHSDTAAIIVIQPLQDINYDTTIVIGDQIALPISNQDGFILFIWTPEDGLSCLGCSNPTVQPLEEITYNVIMEDILGCSTAEGIFHIDIYPETFVELPTTFTPNGDGENDVIYVKGWGIKDLISFQIYNRWGELVFESSELNEGWNGYYKGMLQNNGTYVYKVKVQTFREEEIEKNGHINLMR